MSAQPFDHKRRRLLTVTTTVVGAAGLANAFWPFLASLEPSARALARGEPVVADIGKIEYGQQVAFIWRESTIWVLRRTSEMIQGLANHERRLADPFSRLSKQPAYCRNRTRSIKPEYLVIRGKCTHLGCTPQFLPGHPAPEIDRDWPGGYFCPCHGSKYDLAGRVFIGQPAPLNMEVPKHRYADAAHVVLGQDS